MAPCRARLVLTPSWDPGGGPGGTGPPGTAGTIDGKEPVISENRLDRTELARLLAAMVDDPAMVVPFLDAYGERLAAVVRRHLRDLGRDDLARDGDTVEGLVVDVALLLRDHGGAWRPDGGALPWSWAWSGIRALVVEVAGHARADVELDRLAEGTPAPVAPVTAAAELDLDGLAARVPELDLLLEAIGELGLRERDRRVHVEYRLQVALGDPSPAHTVGAEFGLTPELVRQIDRRVRARLQLLAATVERFAPIAELPWVTGWPVRRAPCLVG